MTDQPTRGEFDLLRQMVTQQGDRIESIDSHGTKGVAVVQAQLTDVVKDLAELKAEVNVRFDTAARGEERWHGDHLAMHTQDKRDRTTARRWLVGIGISGIVAMATVITLLVDVVQHVHR